MKYLPAALSLLALLGCDNSTSSSSCPSCDTVDTGTVADEGSWLMFQDAARVQFVFEGAPGADCAAVDGLWSGEMVLLEVDPEVLWFSDTPEHISFNMSVEDFVALFPSLFPDEPPNAVVSWDEVGEAGNQRLVVELMAPVLDGDVLSYEVCALPLSDPDTFEPLPADEQYIPPESPASIGSISLFIDNAAGDLEVHAEAPTEEEPPAPVYVAFSGGGWHSHTALSGWFAGMLDHTSGDSTSGDVGTVMTHVDAISANSGGSWFLTQLAYSTSFRTSLETDRDHWVEVDPDDPTSEGGYIAQTNLAFDTKHPCDAWSGTQGQLCEQVPYLRDYFSMMSLSGTNELNWQMFVENLVYKPFKMKDELSKLTLSSTRQTWADGRDLVIASSLMTNEVVLNQATYKHWGPDTYWNESYTIDDFPNNFVPLYFISDGTKTLNLLGSGSEAASLQSDWEISGDSVSGSVSMVVSADVPVIDATVASSAAAGALASVNADWEAGFSLLSSSASYTAEDFAPPIQISDGEIEFLTTISDNTYTESSDNNLDEFAAAGTMRVADGGYLDNTATAYLLRHLSNNGLLVDHVNIVLFMNSTTVPGVQAGTQTIPESVAVLFGYDPGTKAYAEPLDDKTIKFPLKEGHFVSTYSAHVFNRSVWLDSSLKADWSYIDADKEQVTLRYYSLEVTTVNNSVFGITENTLLNLHLFINEHSSSSALPSNQSIMSSYTDVYDVTRAAVTTTNEDNQLGWTYLAEALQLQ